MMERVDLSQWIGIIIALLFIFFPVFKRLIYQNDKKKHPDELSEEDGLDFYEYTEALEAKRKTEPPPKPVVQRKPAVPKNAKLSPRSVGKDFDFRSGLDQYVPETRVEKLQTHMVQPIDSHLVSGDLKNGPKAKTGDITQFFKSKRSKRQMIIFHEIFSSPKGMDGERLI